MSAVSVKLVVQGLQHVDDHERCGGAADGREADDIAEQHGNLVVRFGFDGLS
jgi:hypothetical protein